MVKGQGFGAFSKAKHLKAARKGGSRSNARKGTGSLSPEERTRRAREAAQALWRKRRRETCSRCKGDMMKVGDVYTCADCGEEVSDG